MEAVKPQLTQKREVIIRKYEQGCRGRAQVEHPEEEDINTRPFINYLGILQEKMLLRDRILEAKHRHQEAQRVEKWLKMIKHWTQYQSSKKMESRVYKGIPLPVRGKVWSLLLDVDKVKADNPGKYQQMKEQGKLLSEHVHQIDADIRRTFQNHVMFRQRYGVKQQALFHVLLAYSAFDHEAGYRQGMNWVAAVLLMFLDEDDAFWALTQLMSKPKHAMHGFYKANRTKLERLQQHHDNILKCRVPKLKKHLDSQGVSTAAYTQKWFQQCFVDEAPFSLVLRFFDVYILEGEAMLTAMSYTALKIHRRYLLKCSGNSLHEYLQDGLRRTWDMRDDAVLRRLQATKEELVKFKCLLPPSAKQEEMPSMPLGLELASLVPGPQPTCRRRRMGWRQNRVGCAVPVELQAPHTQVAAGSRNNPDRFMVASGPGDTKSISQGAFVFTPVLPLNAGECGPSQPEIKKELLCPPKPAQQGPRSGREAWSQACSAARRRQQSGGREFTALESKKKADEQCSPRQPCNSSVKVLRIHISGLPHPDLGQYTDHARPGRMGVPP
ncbi:USP6 N-terminal-like protein isoform X3 [Oryctolagus cuniculus]|nr:USP6 N-terminal-like protein isoform X3 [Oryctolagus cuniculus]